MKDVPLARLGKRFTQLLEIELPIVQAPMAGISTVSLAAAVAEAGGLGSIAVGHLDPQAADRLLSEARTQTSRSLNVNLFVHATPRRDAQREQAWLERLTPLFEEHGVAPPQSLREIYRSFNDDDEMLEVLLDHKPKVVSFHFGVPKADRVAALHDSGALLMATATSVAEALRLEATGIDMIVAQGIEAGGHRGVFEPSEDEGIGTLALVRQVVRALKVPALAAGGIADGQGIVAALALGASGVQLGTAFLDCPESATPPEHRAALHREESRTELTSVFSGRPARGIVNRMMLELAGTDDAAPAYPVAYDAGKALAAAARQAGVDGFSPMWAGQAARLCRAVPAGELVMTLAEEAKSGLQQLTG